MESDSKKFIPPEENLIAEGLDNRAPFKTILNSIGRMRRGRNKTLIDYIQNTVRQPKKFKEDKYIFPHFAIPSQPRNVFTPDWDGGLPSGFLEQTPYKSLLPYMISKYNEKAAGKPDPVTDIMRRNALWARDFFTMKNNHGFIRKELKNYKDNVLYGPKLFVDVAAHLERTPDPYFHHLTDYNWYYAGKGNLHIVNVEGSDYIIYSVFNCLYISPFFRDNLSIDYNNTVTYECSDDSIIFEIIYFKNIIALRTKFKIVILKLTTLKEAIQLTKAKELDSELPFTSITFDEHHTNIMYVTTLDYRLIIVNIDRMTCCNKKLKGKFSALTNNWSCVVGAQRGNYAHVTMKAITMYDKRTHEPFQRWKSFKYITDLRNCADISAVKYSPGKPLMYVATDHQLYAMDMRCGYTRESNIKPVQRWTHGMASKATYMDVCELEPETRREAVLLASQWFEDTCVVAHHAAERARGVALPYRPPSTMRTFSELQRQGTISANAEKIRRRLCTSLTGLAHVRNEDHLSILQLNSFGDISRHDLYPPERLAYINDDSVSQFYDWMERFEPEKKVFQVSYLFDISSMLSKFSAVPDDYKVGRNMGIMRINNFNENEIYETYASGELEPEFLDIWKEDDGSSIG